MSSYYEENFRTALLTSETLNTFLHKKTIHAHVS